MADGAFTFTPTTPSTPAAVVDELADLLTMGRLSSQSIATLVDVYETVVASTPIDLTAGPSAHASQSSELWSLSPHKAIDGGDDRFTTCSYTGDHELDPPQAPWFELDLGAVQAVQTIVVTGPRVGEWGQHRLNNMNVYLFNTEQTSENVYAYDSNTAGASIGECSCPDGQTYLVGDRYNACGSIQCNGGTVTTACSSDTTWQSSGAGYSVFCGGLSNTNGSSSERSAQLNNQTAGASTLCGSKVQVQDGQVTTRVQCHGAKGNVIRIETPASETDEGMQICDVEVQSLIKSYDGVYNSASTETKALALKQTLKLFSMAPE